MRPPNADVVVLEQYPPLAHHWGWLVLAGGCFVAMIVVIWASRWLCRRLDRRYDPRAANLLDTVRGAALEELSTVAAQTRVGAMRPATAHRRVGQAVRRCVATIDAGNLDFEGLAEIRQQAGADARMVPLLDVLERCQRGAFDPSFDNDVFSLIEDAENVVRTW